VGLKSQLFVYECGGPYGCANFARSTPVVHSDAATRLTLRFDRKAARLGTRKLGAPSVHKRTRSLGAETRIELYSPYGCTYSLDIIPCFSVILPQCCAENAIKFCSGTEHSRQAPAAAPIPTVAVATRQKAVDQELRTSTRKHS
jgi:hypothetical protein